MSFEKRTINRIIGFGCLLGVLFFAFIFLEKASGARGTKIDFVNPDEGMWGFRLGESKEDVENRALALGLKADGEKQDRDNVYIGFKGLIWGREGIVAFSFQGLENSKLYTITLFFPEKGGAESLFFEEIKSIAIATYGTPSGKEEVVEEETVFLVYRWRQENMRVSLRFFKNEFERYPSTRLIVTNIPE